MVIVIRVRIFRGKGTQKKRHGQIKMRFYDKLADGLTE